MKKFGREIKRIKNQVKDVTNQALGSSEKKEYQGVQPEFTALFKKYDLIGGDTFKEFIKYSYKEFIRIGKEKGFTVSETPYEPEYEVNKNIFDQGKIDEAASVVHNMFGKYFIYEKSNPNKPSSLHIGTFSGAIYNDNFIGFFGNKGEIRGCNDFGEKYNAGFETIISEARSEAIQKPSAEPEASGSTIVAESITNDLKEDKDDKDTKANNDIRSNIFSEEENNLNSSSQAQKAEISNKTLNIPSASSSGTEANPGNEMSEEGKNNAINAFLNSVKLIIKCVNNPDCTKFALNLALKSYSDKLLPLQKISNTEILQSIDTLVQSPNIEPEILGMLVNHAEQNPDEFFSASGIQDNFNTLEVSALGLSSGFEG